MADDPEQSDPVEEAPPTDLLTSPIERTLVNRFFVIGGPFALLVAILLSLWVSYMRVRFSVIVQIDQHWVPGEQVAARAQLVDGRLNGVEDTKVELTLRRGASATEIPTLEPAHKGGLAQGTFIVPDVPAGVAELGLRFVAPGKQAVTETLSIQIADERPGRTGTHTVSASTLQWGDDTDPQPPGMRIDLRPSGRLLAGFSNRLLVRITDKGGEPWSGPVEVALLDGEFMGKRGREDSPPKLVASSTDSLGLLKLEGPLTSEVLRAEVRVLATDDPGRAIHRRRFRMVSYAGAVAVDAEPSGIVHGEVVELRARGLSGKRPVFVDVYDDRGAWIDTLRPPIVGNEPPREWTYPGRRPGIVQFEAYHFTNSPGESTAIARIQVLAGDGALGPGVGPLIERQRARLELPRIEKDFDVGVERAYLRAVEQSSDAGSLAREWLLGTLPVEVYGPPTALMTRAREDSHLAARKRMWTLGLRWFLLGGGGLFLALMTALMLRSHASAARKTLESLTDIAEEDQRGEIEDHVRAALRGALLRGVGVIAVMAGALVLTVMLLENLLWEF